MKKNKAILILPGEYLAFNKLTGLFHPAEIIAQSDDYVTLSILQDTGEKKRSTLKFDVECSSTLWFSNDVYQIRFKQD